MYTELFQKDNKSVIEYLRELGKTKNVYSSHRQRIGPLFSDMEGYFYATEEEIILVLIDSGTNTRFENKDEMVWDLAVTCELYRHRLQRLSKHAPFVYAVLLTSDNIIEREVMQEAWSALDIAVIDRVKELDHLSLPVNTDESLPIAFPMDFLYQAEFTEGDYACAEYSLISLIDPDITDDERNEEMDYLLKEFGLDK